MDQPMLQAIFAVILVLIFIFLLVCTYKVAKKSMDQKRRRISTASKQKHQNYLAEEISTGTGYWFNKQDMEDADEVEKLRYQHYFDSWEDCIQDLIIEMYDCGLVRTEELYAIAYGRAALTPDSLIFRTDGLDDDEDASDRSLSLPPVSEDAQRKIYEKWTGYVEQLLQIVEIHTSEEDRGSIIDGLMTYGRKDLSVLLYSPE